MDNRCLQDKNTYPDDQVLARHLGAAMEAWQAFIELLKSTYPLFSPEWRYYNDGKSWLYKVHKKAKTICWVSVWEKYFRATFYFNDKAEELIKKSALPEIYKTGFLRPEKKGKTRPISIEVHNKSALKIVRELIGLKEKIK